MTAEKLTRSSGGTNSKTASINDDFPAADVDWTNTAKGVSSLRDTAAR